ncbi:hypothetical protein TNCV_60241 [Trichonephila clavipes]|nr:hypothetical protein TNCV_60241 [Trichonephila clavipes]
MEKMGLFEFENTALALVSSKIARNSQLSDSEKGEIVGNGRFLRDISRELNIPKSTVASVIKKRKVIGDCRNVFRPSRSTKLRDRDQQVLSKEILKNRTKQDGNATCPVMMFTMDRYDDDGDEPTGLARQRVCESYRIPIGPTGSQN